MADKVFKVNRKSEYHKAGPTDLIELMPVEGCNQIYVLKWILESLVYSIVAHEFIHLSGPTGSAKSSLVEALCLVPDNFLKVCAALGFTSKPVKLFPVEMATYETPGELYQRRALKSGTTYDEESLLVDSLRKAAKAKKTSYPLVWLREMGRVHSSSVQGGLLDLMSRSSIILPDGTSIDGSGIAWVADSNYQAERMSTHTLVTLDDALKRRFSANLTLDYLSPHLEALVLEKLVTGGEDGQADIETINKVVRLGQLIRSHRSDGAMLSVTPPTIYGYMSFMRMTQVMSHLSHQQVALATLLGNAGEDDQKLFPGLFNEVFGMKLENDESTINANLF